MNRVIVCLYPVFGLVDPTYVGMNRKRDIRIVSSEYVDPTYVGMNRETGFEIFKLSTVDPTYVGMNRIFQILLLVL